MIRTRRLATFLSIFFAILLIAFAFAASQSSAERAPAPDRLSPMAGSNCDENFDAVTAPALPDGWTSTATGAHLPWKTSSAGTPDTAPNHAFAPNPNSVSDTILFSPPIAVPAEGGSFSFRNRYNTEQYFDGMVLEISISGGAYRDIREAGGSFATGGYNGLISRDYGSLIGGRSAWTGNSGGYITTTVAFPPAANGQEVRFRWRM